MKNSFYFLKKLNRTAICSAISLLGMYPKKKNITWKDLCFSGWRSWEGNKGEDFPLWTERSSIASQHGELLQDSEVGEARWCRRTWSPYLSRKHQECTFRHRSACRTAAESRQEDLTSGKEYIEPQKLSRMKELGVKTGVLVGKNRSVSRTGPALGW